jgi:hypothetical protein
MPTPLQQVEQNLSEIAVAQVSEKNPNLLSYYLGFDLIDKNDDGTRAAGIMGFKIGGQLIYIPVFFLNGKIKGMEVMYLKNSDTFVSNNEQWVNYISSQNPSDIGEPVSKEVQNSQGEMNNSLRIFSRPPASANSKAASLEIHELSVEDFIDTKIALNESSKDFVDFLKEAGHEVSLNFAKLASEKPEILEIVSRIYDLDEVKQAMEEAKSNSKIKEPKEVKAEKTLELIKSEDVLEDPSSFPDLSKDKKEKMMSKGYAVKDLRDEEDKSDVYVGDYKQEFSQVTDTGYYEMLNSFGDLSKVVVFSKVNRLGDKTPHKSSGYEPQMVFDPKSKNIVWAKEPVYVKGGTSLIKDLNETEKTEVIKNIGGTVADAQVNKEYIALDSKMSAYGPFRVTNKTKDDNRITLKVEQCYVPMSSSPMMKDDGNSDSLDYSRGCDHYNRECFYVRQVPKETSVPEFIGNAMFVGSGVKFVEVKQCDADYYETPIEVGAKENESNSVLNITPANGKTLDAVVTARGGNKVIVEKSAMFDVNVSMLGETLSFRDRGEVVIDLMQRASLSEDSAEKVATEIFELSKRRIVAWSIPRSKKANYPNIDLPSGAAGVHRDGTPIQVEQYEKSEMMPANPGPQNATDMEIGMWDQISDDDIKFLERASDSNARQVFDPAMIGVMVRTSRSQSIVQEYIPELVDNLDRMCRLLLLFYWHNSEFAEEYGIDEMADFEDLLLSTIKSTSKVVLFLKQRAVESSTGQTDVLG